MSGISDRAKPKAVCPWPGQCTSLGFGTLSVDCEDGEASTLTLALLALVWSVVSCCLPVPTLLSGLLNSLGCLRRPLLSVPAAKVVSKWLLAHGPLDGQGLAQGRLSLVSRPPCL